LCLHRSPYPFRVPSQYFGYLQLIPQLIPSSCLLHPSRLSPIPVLPRSPLFMPPHSSQCTPPSTHRHRPLPPSPANPAKPLPQGFSLSPTNLPFSSSSNSFLLQIPSATASVAVAPPPATSVANPHPPKVPSPSTEALPLSHHKSALPLTDLTQAPEIGDASDKVQHGYAEQLQVFFFLLLLLLQIYLILVFDCKAWFESIL
ncbi:hypothetical protein I3843_08G128500, partial [Carya illinoinensis]